jgi:serine/threonine protein phosphatase PrpC
MGGSRLLDWGVASLALAGQVESGDLHYVRPVGRGALVSVVDGLGHGAEAAVAARKAVAALERHAAESLLPLVERCHQALLGTRGVVMSVAFFDAVAASMTWVGVGNVEGVLFYGDRARRPPRVSLLTRGGVVGCELPRLRADVVEVAPGDTLILATDGIGRGFVDGLPVEGSPQQLADHILERFGKSTDDALVFVARYRAASGSPADGGGEVVR